MGLKTISIPVCESCEKPIMALEDGILVRGAILSAKEDRIIIGTPGQDDISAYCKKCLIKLLGLQVQAVPRPPPFGNKGVGTRGAVYEDTVRDTAPRTVKVPGVDDLEDDGSVDVDTEEPPSPAATAEDEDGDEHPEPPAPRIQVNTELLRNKRPGAGVEAGARVQCTRSGGPFRPYEGREGEVLRIIQDDNGPMMAVVNYDKTPPLVLPPQFFVRTG